MQTHCKWRMCESGETRFRQEPVALIADMQAMFYQEKVSHKHVDFLNFLWFPGGDVTRESGCYGI